jgi:DedD protein
LSEYERSYYEIALTNGQVLTVFGALLALVFGAFVSGMWVARRAVVDAPERLAAVVDTQEDPAGETAESVRFFDKASTVEPVPETPAQADAKPAAADTSVQTPAPAQSGRQGRDSVEPNAPPPDTPSAQEGRRAAERAAAEKQQQEAAEEARRKAQAQRAPEVDVPQVSDLPVIQVLSSNDEGQAQQLVRRLKGGGHRAFISPVQVDGRTMYRVRVGPFAERTEAEQAATTLKREFKLDTWITTN